MTKIKEKNKNLLISSFLIILIFVSLFSIFATDPYPTSNEILNSKNSLKLNGTVIKLTTGANFDLQPLSSKILKISGSIWTLNNENINHLFNYDDIINLWVVINSNIYQASEIDPVYSRSNSLFEAKIYHENLDMNINEIKLENSITETIEIVIQFGTIGEGQLLKSETVINIIL